MRTEITRLKSGLGAEPSPEGRSSHFLQMRKSQIKHGLPSAQSIPGSKQTNTVAHNWIAVAKFCICLISSQRTTYSVSGLSSTFHSMCQHISGQCGPPAEVTDVFMRSSSTPLCSAVYQCVFGGEAMEGGHNGRCRRQHRKLSLDSSGNLLPSVSACSTECSTFHISFFLKKSSKKLSGTIFFFFFKR